MMVCTSPSYIYYKVYSLSSKTLWLGHLNKATMEEDIESELMGFGDLESLHLVPPRGCAYVCYTKRKDASKALDKLKGAKLFGSSVKVVISISKISILSSIIVN